MMLPWGHFAVAYLLYSLYSRRRLNRPPPAGPTLAVGVGAIFADLVDKPLGWGLGIIPSRSLGHSLIVAIPLLAVVYAVARVYDREATATAFSISHLVHLFTDLQPRLLLGFPIRNRYLLWPLVTERQFTYWERVFEPPAIVELLVLPLTFRPVFMLLEFVILAFAIRRWRADGRPGLDYLRARLGGSRRAREPRS
ncbi:metal-dependent hydrolase [Natronomonas salina]|uniref:metal-dependent hydrolase n=1 Tax=Natronomonas salina TaxID=1710540 RepID=UPI001BAD0E93|nr:metal-dependent hydrolase [Natronomonas salina]